MGSMPGICGHNTRKTTISSVITQWQAANYRWTDGDRSQKSVYGIAKAPRTDFARAKCIDHRGHSLHTHDDKGTVRVTPKERLCSLVAFCQAYLNHLWLQYDVEPFRHFKPVRFAFGDGFVLVPLAIFVDIVEDFDALCGQQPAPASTSTLLVTCEDCHVSKT